MPRDFIPKIFVVLVAMEKLLIRSYRLPVLWTLIKNRVTPSSASRPVASCLSPIANWNLRERLKHGALANAKLNLEIAEEWFPVEQEAWQRLDREERAAKTSRSAAKSTLRRSTRH